MAKPANTNAEGAPATGAAAAPAAKRKVRKNVARAVVHIKASFNNTHVTITTNTGDAISWGTAGSVGFKGTRKSTPFAAQRAAEQAAHSAMRQGLREVEVVAAHDDLALSLRQTSHELRHT